MARYDNRPDNLDGSQPCGESVVTQDPQRYLAVSVDKYRIHIGHMLFIPYHLDLDCKHRIHLSQPFTECMYNRS